MSGPSPARVHELEAHQRFVAAEVVLDAMTTGRWVATADLAAGVRRLVAAGERRLRWAEGARKAAA